MRIKVGRAFGELFWILDLADGMLEQFGVVLGVGEFNRKVEQPGQILILKNFPAPVVHHQDGVRGGVQLRFKQGRLHAQLLVGEPAFVAQTLFFQGLLHGGSKTRDPVLEKIVCGTVLHGFHGDLLAHGSRNEDERDVQMSFLQQFRSAQAVEMRHGIIRNDDVR